MQVKRPVVARCEKGEVLVMLPVQLQYPLVRNVPPDRPEQKSQERRRALFPSLSMTLAMVNEGNLADSCENFIPPTSKWREYGCGRTKRSLSAAGQAPVSSSWRAGRTSYLGMGAACRVHHGTVRIGQVQNLDL